MQNRTLQKVDVSRVKMLRELSIETFVHTYAQFNTEEDMQHYIETEFSEEKLLQGITSASSAFYFAMENNEAIGYIKVNYAPSQTDINDPEAWKWSVFM